MNATHGQPSDKPLHALSVDVEDWYQVSAFESVVPRSTWAERESRVEANTTVLLDLFDKHDVKGTFFTLGWVAERHPGLIAAVHARGHEVASHGYEHRLVYELSPAAFRADLERTRTALEAATPMKSTQLAGFRAPSFSVRDDTPWIHDMLADLGYRYSSSVFPVRHDRYGIPDFPRGPTIVECSGGRTIYELPMTTWRLFGRNFPAAGGGWLRLLPLAATRRALRQAEDEGRPGMLYLHPWEIDPDQPRLAAASRMSKFRHTVNLHKTASRLERLFERFRFGRMDAIVDGLEAGRFAPPGRRLVDAQ